MENEEGKKGRHSFYVNQNLSCTTSVAGSDFLSSHTVLNWKWFKLWCLNGRKKWRLWGLNWKNAVVNFIQIFSEKEKEIILSW